MSRFIWSRLKISQGAPRALRALRLRQRLASSILACWAAICAPRLAIVASGVWGTLHCFDVHMGQEAIHVCGCQRRA
jgi:hypothetical protein